MNTPSFRTAAFAFAALAATTFAQSGPAFDKATGIRFPKIEFADAKLEDAATGTKLSNIRTFDPARKSSAPAIRKVSKAVGE